VIAAVTVTAMFALDGTLEVMRVGNGAGTVTSTPPGIDCGTDCSESYPPDTPVALVAVADAGSTFTGWGGACSTDPCIVTVNSALMVTAQFTLDQHSVDVVKSGTGEGTVTSTDGTITCGDDCSEVYNYGTAVKLEAVAATGSEFVGW